MNGYSFLLGLLFGGRIYTNRWFFLTAKAQRTQRVFLHFAFSAPLRLLKNLSRQLNLQLDRRLKRIEYANQCVDCNVARIALQT